MRCRIQYDEYAGIASIRFMNKRERSPGRNAASIFHHPYKGGNLFYDVWDTGLSESASWKVGQI
jgi:hypothetical protein